LGRHESKRHAVPAELGELGFALLRDEADSSRGREKEERLHEHIVNIEFHLSAAELKPKSVVRAVIESGDSGAVPTRDIQSLEIEVHIRAKFADLRLPPLRLAHL